MRVSILIVSYRAYAELGGCLDSIAATLHPGDELIVVDYESDVAALAPLRVRHPFVRILAEGGNRGFAAGVNTAARYARGTYLLMLNPDTLVRGPVATMLADWMDQHPEVAVAGPRIENDDGSVQASARRFPGLTTLAGGRSTWLTRRFPHNWFTRRNLVGRDANQDMSVDWVSGACLMTRRDMFDLVGGFDERFFLYWEDADYCRRVQEAGGGVAFVPSVTVRHSAGRSARHDVARAIGAFHQSAFRLFWKHSGPIARLAAPIVWLGLWVRGRLRVLQARHAARAGR